VNVDDVISIFESPSRLPAAFANQVYAAGEFGMGYSVFTVIFKDESTQAYLTGNAVDFIDCPEGKRKRDIAKVLPSWTRGESPEGTTVLLVFIF